MIILYTNINIKERKFNFKIKKLDIEMNKKLLKIINFILNIYMFKVELFISTFIYLLIAEKSDFNFIYFLDSQYRTCS